MDVKIIPFEEKYQDQVTKLIFDILENEFGHQSKSGRPDVKNVSEHYQKDPLSGFWIALNENNEVIGTIGLANCNNGNGNLRRMCVKKELRGTGIAQKLLKVLLDFTREKGYKAIFLSTWDTHIAANKFWLKSGFERIQSLPEGIKPWAGDDNMYYKLEIK